jgi:putative sterol carrier protein
MSDSVLTTTINAGDQAVNTFSIVQRLPEVYDAKAAGDVSATFQFMVGEPCFLTIEAGACKVGQGLVDKADLTITASDENMVKLLKGEINGTMALITGKVKVKGNLAFAQKLAVYFDLSKV